MPKRCVVVFASFLAVASPVFAAPPKIAHDALSCLSRTTNARIAAHIEGQPAAVRVYFHAIGETCGDYYVEMRKSDKDPTLYTGLLPLIGKDSDALTYQIRVDTGGGKEVSIPPVTVAVRTECAAPALSPDQLRAAANITLGLTSQTQRQIPCKFKCNGIKNVITAKGDLQPNEQCRLLLAGLLKPWYASPAGAGAAAGGSILAAGLGYGIASNLNNSKPPSPARP
jgi:hypothetical protein